MAQEDTTHRFEVETRRGADSLALFALLGAIAGLDYLVVRRREAGEVGAGAERTGL